MANFLKKAMTFVGLAEEDENLEEQEELNPIKEVNTDYTPSSSSGKKGKIVNIHTTTQLKVVVHNPDSFENAREIADHLKAKKPVVINLENVEMSIAKRIIDFLSGSVYALDGNIQKIADRIFLIAPYNVGIMGGDFKNEIKNKIVFPFNN